MEFKRLRNAALVSIGLKIAKYEFMGFYYNFHVCEISFLVPTDLLILNIS
jgi:hypothetical protein